jgi:hypothetical protein
MDEALKNYLSVLRENLHALRQSVGHSIRLQQESYVEALLRQERYTDPRRLARHEFKVYSQNGEDGILREIFRRIGISSHSFVEIGVGNGLECNTTFLVAQGWTGCWIEGDRKNVEVVSGLFRTPLARGRLKLGYGMGTAENIGAMLRAVGAPDQPDVLSVDVDQNTYWLWKALPQLKARVVVVEYNASYPPDLDWKASYAPERVWDGTNYFGASLKAFEILGRDLGYNLVACDLAGVNAFFVRQDLSGGHFLPPFNSETHYEPPRYWLYRLSGHPPGPGTFSELEPVASADGPRG